MESARSGVRRARRRLVNGHRSESCPVESSLHAEALPRQTISISVPATPRRPRGHLSATMNTLRINLDLLLRAAALAQLGIAALNLVLVRIMNWKPDLDRAPLLIREVFHVHCIFISITLTIFGVLTWQFSSEIAAA